MTVCSVDYPEDIFEKEMLLLKFSVLWPLQQNSIQPKILGTNISKSRQIKTKWSAWDTTSNKWNAFCCCLSQLTRQRQYKWDPVFFVPLYVAVCNKQVKSLTQSMIISMHSRIPFLTWHEISLYWPWRPRYIYMIKLNLRWKKGGQSLVGSAFIPDAQCAVWCL